MMYILRMNTLSQDVIQIIMCYLDNKTIWLLKKNKIINSRIANEIIIYNAIENINKKINKLLTIEPFFNNILNFKNVYISGSFILQCILDERYIFSDIDIYTNNIQIINLLNTKDIQNIICDYNPARVYDIYLNDTNIVDKLQIIYIETKNIYKSINKYFDFDFLKNIYNYKKKKLFIFNIESVMDKISNIYDVNLFKNKEYYKIKNKIKRIGKYEGRGFNIIYNKNVLQQQLFDINNNHIIRSNFDMINTQCYYSYYYKDYILNEKNRRNIDDIINNIKSNSKIDVRSSKICIYSLLKIPHIHWDSLDYGSSVKIIIINK